MGELFVIDGNDGSGKKVQTTAASERIGIHHNVRHFDFPDYTTPTGKLIQELLYDPEIDFVKLPPKLAFLPYALNRAAKRNEIMTALQRGHVVCDRYVETNWAYQAAKIDDPAKRAAFIEFAERVEYGEVGMPRPAAVIFLSVPIAVSRELMLIRAAKAGSASLGLDQYERNLQFQEKVSAMYHELARDPANRTWHIVECVRDGVMRPPESISEEVWQIIGPLLRPTPLSHSSQGME